MEVAHATVLQNRETDLLNAARCLHLDVATTLGYAMDLRHLPIKYLDVGVSNKLEALNQRERVMHDSGKMGCCILGDEQWPAH